MSYVRIVSYSVLLGSITAVYLMAAASPAVLGLSFVFERFVWLYGVLKLLGGVYLLYLGVEA